jgi:hypothetical protein
VRFLALSALVFGLPPFHSAIRPLAPPERAQLIGEFWHAGCPVPLSSLSLLTVSHWDFAGNVQTGQLVVNRRAAAPLARVLRRLYGMRFPIRHMTFSDYYGPKVGRPRDGDVSEGFECRRAVPSPCGSGTGNWSQHAYGLGCVFVRADRTSARRLGCLYPWIRTRPPFQGLYPCRRR